MLFSSPRKTPEIFEVSWMSNGSRVLVQQRSQFLTVRSLWQCQPNTRERLTDCPRTGLSGSQFLNGSVAQSATVRQESQRAWARTPNEASVQGLVNGAISVGYATVFLNHSYL